MKSISITTAVQKIICWVLLIQMINLCTDPIDQIYFKNGHTTHEEDLSINEIESVYEFVSENVFDQDVPETDERDEDAFVKTFHLYHQRTFTSLETDFFNLPQFPTIHTNFYQESFYANYPEINSPPPKHA